MLLYHVVHISIVAIEVSIISLLLVIGDLSTHAALPSLSNDLRFLHLALLGKLGALLDGICRQDLEVGVLFKEISVVGDVLLVADDAHAFAPV